MPNRNIQDANGYRYAYQGQEKDPETGKEAFELRLWDGRIGRWLTTDPASEFHSPYLGMGNNPIRLTDPDGGHTDDDYTFDKSTGKFTLVNKTTDTFDRVLKTNRRGEIKYDRRGNAKVVKKLGNIAKGILKDGINFKKFNATILVNGANSDGTKQPTLGEAENFITNFSDYISKEISGYGLGDNASSIEALYTWKYKNNTFDKASDLPFTQGQKITTLFVNGKMVKDLNAQFHFHTHPYTNKIEGTGLSDPSNADRKHKISTSNLSHFILSSEGKKGF